MIRVDAVLTDPESSGPALPVADDPGALAAAVPRLLAETYYRDVWRVMRRLGVQAESIDDATQQVFLVVAQKQATIRAGSERGFLMAIAVRTAANLRRARARQRERLAQDDCEAFAAGELPADELLERQRLRRLLDQALDALDPDARAVFVLYELEGLLLHEIAEALSIPRGTVSSRLRRARELFRSTVKRLRGMKGSSGGNQP